MSHRFLTTCAALVAATAILLAQQPAAGRGAGRGGRGGPPVQPKPEDLARIKAKTDQIEALVTQLKSKHADADLTGDVEVYAHAGRMLLEFPELVNSQNAIDHSALVLDQGIERGNQLLGGQSPWNSGNSQIHAYYSALDGSVQPYHVSLPANYDATKPTR
ncbi:MAG: hypothetical protein M3N54_09475, partial [Acidobacteriota bacterium]|nr:hypothetical protein [Acidobacteriota bacterium]